MPDKVEARLRQPTPLVLGPVISITSSPIRVAGGEEGVESAQMWGPMMVTAAVAIIPPFVVYLIAQKQIIETFVNSGIKG